MKEHPLLMQGPLVRATLEGRKTQTRRPVKPQPDNDIPDVEYSWAARCPMGQAGDRLWVRETFAMVHGCQDIDSGYVDEWMVPLDIPKDSRDGFWSVLYRAEDERFDESGEERGFSWRPSIHMPRWACRLVLPLVSVRVERVQDITEEDAKAEGVERISSCKTARDSFRALWISIYGEASWDANPWVWVAEWKEIEVSK